MNNLILNQYRSGSGYKDVIGQLYHFPKRYLNAMSSLPSNFIYYEPRDGGSQLYFGTGIIRSVCEDTEEADHYYAELSDYQPFQPSVNFYDGPNEKSWESWKNMRNSVHRIEGNTFNSLLAAGKLFPIEASHEWVSNADLLRKSVSAEISKLKKDPTLLRKIQKNIEVFERPNHITNAVKKTRGYKCQLCGTDGFGMKNGRKYCEVHHLFHLSVNPPPECLEATHVVVLCATCHRRMHYANVGIPERHATGWMVNIDGINQFLPYIR